MPDEADPPRKNYGFKERTFQRDNPHVSETGPMPTAQELAQMAGPVTRSTPVSSGAKADDPNDVYATLKNNRTAEKAAGSDNIEIRKKATSRRTKDYWLLLLGGNALLIGGSVYMGGPAIVFGLAGVIVYSLGLTWVVWQIMGRY